MRKFYFTYGSDEQFPFQNGYSIVIADDIHQAIGKFRKYHPNREGSNCINCAFYYTENEWNKTCMANNNNYPCYEVIGM